MNQIAIKRANEVSINADTRELIEAGVSDNTHRAYGRALHELHKRRGTEFNDPVLSA